MEPNAHGNVETNMLRILMLLVVFSVAPACADEPTDVVVSLHDALLGIKQLPVDQRIQGTTAIIQNTHDLQFIARLLLGPQWSNLRPDQQREFVAAFRAVSVATYLSRFGSGTPPRFQVTADEAQRPDRHKVVAQLLPENHEPIEFEYLLTHTSQGWRIVNIVVDGVSDLALRRAEYSRILRDNGFSGLIDYLDEQRAGLDMPAGLAE